MENLMNINPGLIIWTIVIFLVFLALASKLFLRPMLNALDARENRIATAIEEADKKFERAQKLLLEREEQLRQSQNESSAIINKGRTQAEEIIKKATEEADKIRHQKVEDAKKEIERSKESALMELRNEVAGLIVQATEKILDETLDKEKHYKLVESYIEKIPQN